MKTSHAFALVAGVSCSLFAALLVASGCEKKPEAPKPAAAGTKADDHQHADGDGHDHDHDHDHDHSTTSAGKPDAAKPDAPKPNAGKPDAPMPDDGHSHGPTTELGEQVASGSAAVGSFTIKASRDGDVQPGGDVPIDVWVTGGTAKVATVRFWIGTQDARGSMKAKAELEKDNWHTHAEVPKPLSAEGKLWVEVETESGEKVLVGFDLKL